MNKISFYPLIEFFATARIPLQIDDGLSIVYNSISFDNINKINISEEDINQIKYPPFCLQVDEEKINPEEASLLFILACRLLKRTKVFIRYRVDSLNQIRQIRDDYPYINSVNIAESILDDELIKISKLYSNLNNFRSLNTRSGNASYFLSLAYRSHNWLESLIFHVCSLETLISAPEQEGKITEKFINRITNFIGYDVGKLEKIYNVRSELVHGRHNHESENENLELKKIAEEENRLVFSKILLTPHCFEAFKNETTRLKMFNCS